MKLIVGLGNPGEKYVGVRHNLGFEVVEELVKKIEVEDGKWKFEKKFKSEILKWIPDQVGDDKTVILAKPQTYMNNSGLAVKLISSYYHLASSDIIVIHDDLDLLLGKIKVRTGGAAAGHHGVESIIKALGRDTFTRIKLGIGNDKSHAGEHQRVHFEAEKFVLEVFLPGERPKVKSMIKQAVSILEKLILDNPE